MRRDATLKPNSIVLRVADMLSKLWMTNSVIYFRLLNSRTVSGKFLTFFWSIPMVTYSFSCLYTKSSYKNVNKKSLVMLMELILFFPNNN
jgi:hypothetical protein